MLGTLLDAGDEGVSEKDKSINGAIKHCGMKVMSA